ncbi:non-ribosomal peptide synthetase [Streptacidiphilus sp. P02-A3a]|uniref:non-ribosomal peptide synthetase n=1 Tax=Streptacidiphilus sp. P02-A3a TaxID=2704468 RepID=UPI0015FA34EB|nr:non-ribosomal peptide synthetase [Streptacidiphilus sp. P02-A3a]QMU70038.1 amino acid adenylation domain-containing protein [Streptacidiphilus sp. P02-A3a]
MSKAIDMTSPADASTLVAVLRRRAETQPRRRAFGFLTVAGGAVEELSYAELDRRVRELAARLEAEQPVGSQLLLIFPPGLDFVVAFFACLYAGMVAVPMPLPTSRKRAQRQLAAAADARARVWLTVAASRRMLDEHAAQADAGPVTVLTTDGPPTHRADEWSERCPDPADLAFLQYTSGSTGNPRGVMVTHRNLMANAEAIREKFALTEQDSSVIWLPPFHDMGLIGGLLQPVHTGFPALLMPPQTLMRDPASWLEAISEHRATVSGGPNFGYAHCVRHIDAERAAALDLSSWRVAFNGAEPIRAETQDSFAEAFRGAGFDPRAFFACYGIAEATLLVTGTERGAGARVLAVDGDELAVRRRAVPVARGGRRLVSCGTPATGHQVLIVDPEHGREVADGAVGEIWVSGPSVARGYLDAPEATAAAFGGRVDGMDGADGADGMDGADGADEDFLRTGDLGFRHQGELYVTGRVKDLIVVRGRNVHPQDAERIAAAGRPALDPDAAAAFGYEEDGAEALGIVLEVDRHSPAELLASLADGVRTAVTAELDVSVGAVVFTRRGGVPRTTSGKIRRQACREQWLRGELPRVGAADPAPAAPVGDVRAVLADVARLSRSALDDAAGIFDLGLDSLGVVNLRLRILAELGADLALSTLLAGPTVAELVAAVASAPRAATVPEPTEDHCSGASLGQEALLLADELAGADAPYVVGRAVKVLGAFRTEDFLAAVRAVVDRHPALRTVFVPGDEALTRVAHRQLPPELAVIDAREDGAGPDGPRLTALLADAACRRMDPATGPLVRVTVLRTAETEAVVVFAVHHAVCDLRSLGLLLLEVAAGYQSAEAVRRDEPVAEAHHTAYGAFAAEQRRLALAGTDARDRLGRYWRTALDGVPLEIRLPMSRTALGTARGAVERFVVPADLSAQVHDFARAHRLTVNAVLQTALHALLHRLTGEDRIAIGTPSANRGRTAWFDVVGYFVNVLPLVSSHRPGTGFARAAADLQLALGTALEHGELPYAGILQAADRSTDRCNVLVAYQSLRSEHAADIARIALEDPRLPVRVGGLTMLPVPLPRRDNAFDLTMNLADAGAELLGNVEYRADLFAAADVRQFVGHYLGLLRSALADPARPVADLSLSGTPQSTLPVLAEPAAAGAYDETGLTGLVDQWVRRTPEATAVTDGHRTLSYRELDLAAGRLAAELVRRGVGVESVVGVLTGRRADTVIALLGVLKAGAAYLPLDPSLPDDRLRWILDRAAAPLVVAAGEARELPDGLPVVPAEPQPRLPPPPPAPVRPDNLAYVLFTSGSTGRPKGVALTHRNAVSFLAWARERFGTELRAVLAATSFSFDLSVFEVFGPLSSGGTVVLARDVLVLAEGEPQAPVTLVNTVPSPLAELLRTGRLPDSVRTVNLAGEPLPRPLAEAVLSHPAVERLMNLYGPTEATTYACEAEIRADDPGEPPIGRPISGTHAYVLDARLRPVAPGVPGELYLGGPGLARGYLRAPGLTADRFLPDLSRPGQRMYRTGDVVRVDADGVLRYLGRSDDQVKIRGFRIEPEDCAVALRRHPGVAHAAVLPRELPGTGPALCAWVVPAEGSTLEPDEVRAFARTQLPAYMVPSAVAVVRRLPRTPNGKLDKRALATPEPPARTGATAPSGPVERRLLEIFAELLARRDFGVEDSFFDLGGHSLLVARLVSEIRRAFDVALPLRAVFAHPRVRALAPLVAGAAGRSTDAVPLRPVPRQPVPAPSSAQERMWLVQQMMPGSTAYSVVGAVHAHGPLDPALLRRALAEVGRHHEVLRTRLLPGDGGVRQVIDDEAGSGWTEESLERLPESERTAAAVRRMAELAARPVDLGGGEPVRLVVLRLAADEHLVGLVSHLAVMDGWSSGVFFRHLALAYRSLSRDQPPGLPELPVQYADYAAWQRTSLAPVRGELLSWWTERLDGLPPLALPADRPRPPVMGFRGGTVPVRFGRALRERLAGLGADRDATLFMVLLTAFGTVLTRHSGQRDFAVGTPIADRPLPELDQVIGPFTNTLPIRLDLSGDPSFARLLDRTRERALEAYAHAALPFETLVGELGLARDLSRTPVFQTMLSLQDDPLGGLDLPGVRSERLDVPHGTARFDLLLALSDGPAGLFGALEFNQEVFDRETAEQLVTHLTAVLERAVADPGTSISRIPLLGAEQTARILHEWNDTAAPQRPAAIHTLFDEQEARTPEAVAVADSTRSWTYRELRHRAEDVARELLPVPGRDVAVLMGRSAASVAAVLGVLKAGKAYVPIDPAFPEGRVNGILDICGARCLVTDPEQLARAEALAADRPGTRVLLVDPDADPDAGSASAPGRGELPLVAPESVAYTIFTSGSTGVPQGVVLQHAAVVNTLRWVVDSLGFGPSDRLLWVTSLSFDLSVFDIFGTLAAGGLIRVAEAEELAEPARLAELLVGGGITVWDSAPAALQRLLPALERRAARPGDPAVRLVMLSGDWIPVTMPDRLRELLPGCRVRALGGATEAAIWSNHFPVERVDPAWTSIPYGRPIQNARYHVLDRWMQPCPVGVPGDLYIGGACLALGYVDPKVTAQRFLPDPHSGRAGERLYRTGDLARYWRDGTLEFLGRSDQQVKIRGFRVEPGEVEAVLRRCADVREATVVVRDDLPGGRCLVGYAVPTERRSLDEGQLRKELRAQLPEYMVPTHLVLLDRLPVTANGKLDRRALPAPVLGSDGVGFLSPRAGTEQVIAGIWSRILGVERPGSRDNVFDLGGNSLRLAEMHVRLQESFGERIQLVHLFENPTIEGLARTVDGLAADGPAVAETAADRTQDRAERQKQAMQRRRAPRRAE